MGVLARAGAPFCIGLNSQLLQQNCNMAKLISRFVIPLKYCNCLSFLRHGDRAGKSDGFCSIKPGWWTSAWAPRLAFRPDASGLSSPEITLRSQWLGDK